MKDQEHILMWRNYQDKQALIFLYEKYFNKLKSAIIFMVKNNFHYLPVLYDEITSVIYEGFYKAVNEFNLEQNKYYFDQALFVITRTVVLKYLHKLINKNQQILNFASSYDHNKFPFSEHSYNLVHTDRIDSYLIYEEQQALLNQFISLQKAHTQKIILLHLQGYKNACIAKKLNLSQRQITNQIYQFIKKAKIYFKQNYAN